MDWALSLRQLASQNPLEGIKRSGCFRHLYARTAKVSHHREARIRRNAQRAAAKLPLFEELPEPTSAAWLDPNYLGWYDPTAPAEPDENRGTALGKAARALMFPRRGRKWLS